MEKLERKLEELQQQISDPAFYQQSHDATAKVLADVEQKQQELDVAMERWAELEELAGG